MNLLGKAMDKDFWKEVREKDCYKKYRAELFEQWEQYCEDKPITALKYSDFKQFFISGDRASYENEYFSRRMAAECSALLSLIYPEEEKYLSRLMDEIYAICDEYTWCVPAHQGKLEENNNSNIDLFASETAFSLAEIYTLLKDRLEPLIKNRLMAEMDRRIFGPYTAVKSYSWWESGNTNWTAVCSGSVACAFMLMRPDLAKELLPRFERSMEHYLSGFADDGICTEGCGYWQYGFGFFTVYADMVQRFTNGECDWFKNEKVKTIATFLQKMFISGNTCASFSDGRREIVYHLGLCHYLKDVYPDDVVVYDPKYSCNYDVHARFCFHLRSAIWMNEEYFYHPTPDNSAAEHYAPDAQWFVKRTSSYGFAAKGGCNAEPHNHNDVGSFIFAKNGRQMLVDMGVGSYTRQYFDKDTRYTIVECSSRGHSVPIVDGTVQFYGREAAAKSTKFENGVFYTDIGGAYRCDGLEGIKRSFAFTEKAVTLTDVFAYSGGGEIIDRIVTLYPPKIEGDTVTVEDVSIRFDPGLCEATVGSEVRQKEGVCYFIDFKLLPGVKKFVCEIQ